MKNQDYVGFNWTEHNGATVKIDGLNYRLKVMSWKTVYPYEMMALDVAAEIINKEIKTTIK